MLVAKLALAGCGYTIAGIQVCFDTFCFYRMEGFASDAAYQTFDKSIDDGQPTATTTQQNIPNRYKTKSKNTEEKARAREARRTRRTMRMEQQEQKKREDKQKEIDATNPHYKISYSSDSSEDSSVDENYEVDSIAESEIESLTYVLCS